MLIFPRGTLEMWHSSLPVAGQPPPPPFHLPPPPPLPLLTNVPVSPQFQQNGGALLPLPFPPSSAMYPPSLLLPPPPPPPPQPDPVDMWKKGISQPSHTKANNLSIPKAHELTNQTHSSLSTLLSLHNQLQSVSAGSPASEELWNQVWSVKNNVRQCMSQLTDDTVKSVAKRICHRKLQRGRRMRCLLRHVREKEQHLKEADRASSEWLAERRRTELKMKLERSIEAAANDSLSSVRRKTADVQYHVKLLTALRELRDHRRESSKKKGDAPPIEADESFSSRCDSLQQLLSQQEAVYVAEERALKVMISEQVESELTQQQQQGRLHLTRETLQDSDADPHIQYYLQAQHSPDSMIAIRSQWDQYLSPYGTPVPSVWVESDLPTNDQWARYLK